MQDYEELKSMVLSIENDAKRSDRFDSPRIRFQKALIKISKRAREIRRNLIEESKKK